MKKITTFFFLSLMTLATFAQQPELFSDQMGKYGYRDASGKEIVPLKYDNAGDFAEERARVCVGGQYDDLTGDWWGGKWGFIDKTGKEVVPLTYDNASDFSQELAAVQLKGKWGFIDKTGKVIIPFTYKMAGDFSNGRAVVMLDGRDFFIDKTGKEVK